MRKPILSALFPQITAALVAGALVTTSVVPVVQAAPKHKAAAHKRPSHKTREEARKAYGAGEKAYGSGDYADAYDNFKKANDLIPSPNAEYWMAMSLDKGGKLDEAMDAYQTFLNDPGASKVGADKVSSAQSRLDDLKKMPAALNLTTTPPGASVSVDGQAQMGETPMVVKVPPGTHEISVSATGYEASKFEVTVKPGEKQNKDVTLEQSAAPAPAPAPVPAPAATPAPVSAPPPTSPPPPEHKSKVPAYVTLGIAGAGVVVGTIFGIEALGAKSDFNKTPTNDNADKVERDALISDMSFGVAITLGVTGIVLLTSSTSGTAPAESGMIKLPKKATLDVAPYMSTHGGGAAARLTF
jgi:PEGA domain